MRYDSFSDYALDDLYRPAAFVSAVVLCFLFLASPAQANYIYDHATGSWKPTSRTVLAPPGSSSPFSYVPRDSPPPSVTSAGGFQNKAGGAFGSPPVNGASRTVPVTVNGTTTKPNVNKSLLSRLGKGGLAGLALGAGIDALLDGIGALIDDGGNVSRRGDPSATLIDGNYWIADPAAHQGVSCNNPNLHLALECAAAAVTTAYPTSSPSSGISCEIINNTTKCSQDYSLPQGIVIRTIAATAPFIVDLDYDLLPIPLPELEDAINSDYQPHPSDYPTISAEPDMIPTIVEVEPIQRITIPPATTTTIDLDTGETTVVETNIWHDFNIKDNNTNQPKIEAETTTKTETYVDGDKTSETTITNNTGTTYPEGATDSQGNQLEIPPPVDCDLFPTACAWMEWTQEEPDEPDDDLSQLLQEVPIVNETFTITGGTAGCPAPLVLNLSQFGSRTVSYQPLCDLASTMKFLYLALMSFAAAVLLHRSISRV